jgi:acyl-CoA reductase-like NAD-dependent aldehyde dehydrogenase
MDGAMFNSGQCCCGIERIYVARALYDAFVEKAVDLGRRAYKLGNPLDEATTLGPMAKAALRRMNRARPDRRGRGARRARPDRSDLPRRRRRRLSRAAGPHDVNHDMRVMREESFGPVVGIMPVEGRRTRRSR